MFRPYDKTIVITNRNLVKADYYERLKLVASLHPRAIILREKELSEQDYEVVARKVLSIAANENVNVFIHTWVNVAVNLGCKNIHISIQELLKNSQANSLSFFDEISVSCHSMDDVATAVKHGATQIVLGTIFETDCKKGLKGKGTSFVSEICKACSVPVYAIGGINFDNLNDVIDSGAAGGCMMSLYMNGDL